MRSELIWNPDGSIYHLGLKPGDVAQVVITVGDPERVAKVSRHFDEIESETARREFVAHTGSLGGKRLTVISTGIGTDNVDIVLNELHALFLQQQEGGFPYFNFIRIGTSGAVREDVPVGAILLSEAAVGLDGLLPFYNYHFYENEIDALVKSHSDWKNLPRPYAAFAGEKLASKFEKVADQKGVTLTAAGFYAPQGRSVYLPAKVKNFTQLLSKSAFAGIPITNIEMETAGIYGLAKLLGHQAVSLNAILANRMTGEFAENPEKIVEDLIEKVLEKIVEF